MAVLKVAVLLYAPEVTLIVATDSGTFDVSEDIVSGSCTLTENQSHQMTCTLLNKGRRYDKLFKPNDRFVLYLKRLQKLLIMTGYLDVVPFFSVWPRSITITGESTLKRLQYHWWDPGTPASVTLFNTAGAVTNAATGTSDDSLVSKATSLITNVANWNPTQVHFSALPSNWVTKVAALWQSIAPQIGINPSAALGTMPIIQGATPFTSGITTLSLLNPAATTLSGQPLPGSALPADFGTATNYQGSQDVQKLSSWYCQMQWGYQNENGVANPGVNATYVKNFLKGAKIMVGNPDANSAVIVEVAGWGPPAGANAVIGLSPDALKALAITPDPTGAVTQNNQVQIAWVLNPSQVALGVYNAVTQNSTNLNINNGTKVMGVSGNNARLLGQSGIPNQALPLQYNNTSYTPSANGSGPEQPTSYTAGIAVSWATQQVGKPYQWGGAGPNSFDCSGLTMFAWSKVGVVLPHYVGFMSSGASQNQVTAPLPADPSTWLPGDLVFYGGNGYDGSPTNPGHVKMYIGNNQTVEAPHTGANVFISRLDPNFVGAGRVTKANVGSGQIQVQGQNVTQGIGAGGGGTGSGANGQSGSFDTIWTWFANMTQATDPLSTALTGYRAMMNDTPFLPTVQMVVNATMRSFCSAPNGDFIAWFPDYFNVYGTLGCVQIQDIELQDFTVNWSDLAMVTHQFAAGTFSPFSNGSQVGGAVTDIAMQTTGGVATIDFPQILEALFNLNPNDPTFSPEGLYTRFGARPNFISLGTLYGQLAEFWYALYMFQYNWAAQFAATLPISFMPELYPGMIMQVPSQNVQVYVQQVQHSWNLAEGGGFTTQATVCAPSAMSNAGLHGFAKGSSSVV